GCTRARRGAGAVRSGVSPWVAASIATAGATSSLARDVAELLQHHLQFRAQRVWRLSRNVLSDFPKDGHHVPRQSGIGDSNHPFGARQRLLLIGRRKFADEYGDVVLLGERLHLIKFAVQFG